MTTSDLPARHVTRSAAETVALGRAFSHALTAGDVVLLCGAMGAGKTYFAKGLVAAFGGADEDDVASPAYDIVHRFAGRETVFHYDLFRMQTLSDDDVAWLTESLMEDGVHVVEWGDRIESALHRSHYKVTISAGESEDERVVAIEARP